MVEVQSKTRIIYDVLTQRCRPEQKYLQWHVCVKVSFAMRVLCVCVSACCVCMCVCMLCVCVSACCVCMCECMLCVYVCVSSGMR